METMNEAKKKMVFLDFINKLDTVVFLPFFEEKNKAGD